MDCSVGGGDMLCPRTMVKGIAQINSRPTGNPAIIVHGSYRGHCISLQKLAIYWLLVLKLPLVKVPKAEWREP